ncbi:MAG: tetratricopeptide repeat protein, partial [Anaerolineae bacterium]|nr:tetratricopeptide repeat protein [Anaerolineae bacterium]
QGGLALVFGEAGVGKTRLAQELARNAEWRGIRTLWGQCYELAAPPAYQPLAEALRAGLPSLEKAALDPLWRGELARLLPELVTDGVPAPTLPPAEEHRRLLEAITRAFLAMAAAAPCLLLLEDVHWIDLASLEVLRYLLPRLADARLLVVMTLRTEEMTGHQAEVLTALENTRLPHRLNLARLDLDETGELVRQALDLGQAAPRFSTRLYAETEGNPFFVIETLRGLVDEGLLRRDAGGGWSTPWDEATQDYAELPLPTGVTQSIQRRLDRLPGPLAEALGLAAVIGREVAFDLWQQTSDRSEIELLAAGDELCGRGLLLPAGPDATGADYVFAHDQIRRVTYERLTAPRRRLYHRQVAEALTRLAPDEPEALAHHWTQAGVWDQAAIYHQQAGDRARAVYANAEATAHYAKALDALSKLAVPPDPDRLFALRLDCEAVNGLVGDRAAQARELDALEALVEKWPSAEQRAQVALRRARYSEETGDYAAAIATAQAAVTLTQSTGAIELEGRALVEWGRVLWRRGEYDAARAQFEKVLALADERGLRRLKADALNLLGNVYLYQGDYAQARACYERTLPLHRELGNRQGEGSALYNLGYVVHDLGDLATASTYYQQALDIYREIGFRRGEGTTLMIYGNVLQSLGDYLSARDHYEQALHILSDVGNRQSQASALANIGSILMALGVYAAAQPYFERTLSIHREVGDRRGEGAALASLSSFFHFVGDNEAAEEYARQALSIFREIGDRYHQGHALTYWGHALSGLGQLDIAADAYRQAVELRCELGELHLAMESLAGLLRISLAHGDLPQALAHTERILNHLEGGSLDGTDEPMHIYLTCYRALHAVHDLRAAEILETAHASLQERAAGIDDEGMRRSFLENVAAHREIVAAYRERWPQQQTVRLPRAGVPTGRPLRGDEYVTIAWTVDAPEDEQAASKTSCRRRRLLRMLRQAEAQGATPTVDDLAVALDVSRATLKRDLAALRRAGHKVKTRGSPK